jgi:hypothetical protein
MRLMELAEKLISIGNGKSMLRRQWEGNLGKKS